MPFVALTLAGVVAMSAIGAILFVQSRDSGIAHEQRTATRRAVLAGRAIVARLLTARILHGQGTTLTELDRVLREHVLRDGVVRVKLWRSDERILYSDEPRLIGGRFPLGAKERGLLAAGSGTWSELSDLNRPENRFEREHGRLIEVYTPLRIRSGSTLLFEEYQRFEPTAESGGQFVLSVLPALGIGLLLLEVANLAWRGGWRPGCGERIASARRCWPGRWTRPIGSGGGSPRISTTASCRTSAPPR